jgi:hypothetical protein
MFTEAVLVHRDQGYVARGTNLRITPDRKWAWGIEVGG